VQQKIERLEGVVRLLEARLAAPLRTSRSAAPAAAAPASPSTVSPRAAEPASALLRTSLLGLLPGGDWTFGGALSPLPTARPATATPREEPGGEDSAALPAPRPASYFPSWGSPIAFPGIPAAEAPQAQAQPAAAADAPDAAAAGQCRQQ
jgi:hypothetical protein